MLIFNKDGLPTFLEEILATFGIAPVKGFAKNDDALERTGKKVTQSVKLKKHSELIFGHDSIPGFMIEKQLPSCGHFGQRGMI